MEDRVHRKATSSGLSLGAPVDYVDLPMVMGYGEGGSPRVEVTSWPFILPGSMVPWSLVLFPGLPGNRS